MVDKPHASQDQWAGECAAAPAASVADACLRAGPVLCFLNHFLSSWWRVHVSCGAVSVLWITTALLCMVSVCWHMHRSDGTCLCYRTGVPV